MYSKISLQRLIYLATSNLLRLCFFFLLNWVLLSSVANKSNIRSVLPILSILKSASKLVIEPVTDSIIARSLLALST